MDVSPYQLKIKHAAERDLRRLPPTIFHKINPQSLSLRENPRPPGVRKLKGNREGWRIRVGDYRVVYQIDDERRIVSIVRVRHRRDIYGP